MSKIETANSKAQNKAPENLAVAVEALKRGHVIVFPTETLYGLGADALDEVAVEKVFQLKGRDPRNPIPVLVADQRNASHPDRKGTNRSPEVDGSILARTVNFGSAGEKEYSEASLQSRGRSWCADFEPAHRGATHQATRPSLDSYQRQPIRQGTGSNSSRGTDVFCRPDSRSSSMVEH